MRLIMKLFLCIICLGSMSAFAQDRINKVMVGPNNDQFRVVVAIIEPTSESYRMQSMIIDLNPVKNTKEEPSSFQVDLTSTVRSLSTGEKKQRILILRWKKTREIELKCDGKWAKQNAGATIDNIVEATKLVIRSVPLDSKKTTEVSLPEEVEKKISSLFNAFNTESIPCLRNN